LRAQLEIANFEKKELMGTILGLVKPEVIQSAPIIVEPVKGKGVPWHIRQRELEEEDRVKAKIERRIEKEEKELGITEEAKNA